MASRSSEKTKRMFLVGCGVLFAAVLVYQLFFSSPTPKPRRPDIGNTQAAQVANTTGRSGTPQAPKRLSAAEQHDAAIQELLSDLTPLSFASISKTAGKASPGNRGNVFAYYVDPPRPTPPPPPPPPIQLLGVQPQSAVAGTPRTFTLTITGNKIPPDAQIFFDGAPRPTKRNSETQLSTEVMANDYAFARSINIDVKSKSDPKNNSNPITFVVQAGPEPQFIYKGRLGALNQPQSNYAVFELNSTKEIKRGKVGDTIMGVWRIDAISENAVDVTHTQYDIKRRVPLQDKVRQ